MTMLAQEGYLLFYHDFDRASAQLRAKAKVMMLEWGYCVFGENSPALDYICGFDKLERLWILVDYDMWKPELGLSPHLGLGGRSARSAADLVVVSKIGRAGLEVDVEGFRKKTNRYFVTLPFVDRFIKCVGSISRKLNRYKLCHPDWSLEVQIVTWKAIGDADYLI